MPKRKLTDPFIKKDHKPEKRIEIYDEIVNGLAIRITPTGHKSFVYRYRSGNQVKRFTLGPYPTIGVAEARKRAREKQEMVSKGIDPLIEKKKVLNKPKEQTFDYLIQIFKGHHLPTLREDTRNEYERIIKADLQPALGNMELNSINRRDILNILDYIANIKGAKVMANRTRAVLSKMFNLGVDKDFIKANPVNGTKPYSKAEKSRERFYTPDEIRELWNAFNMQPEPARSVLKMLMICGQRSKETRHMKWENINGNTWTIPKKLSKGDRGHEVPLPEMALQVLDERRQLAGKSEWVFESPRKPGQPLGDLRNPKYSSRKLSGVKDFRPHDLRRTMATHMAMLKVDSVILGKILNHKEAARENMVTAIYNRYSYMDEKRKAMNRWDQHLQQIIDETETKIHRIA